MLRIRVMLFLISISTAVSAQYSADTVLLNEVSVYGIPVVKYSTGAKVQTLDSLLRQTDPGATLSDILAQNTPIYIKEYGNGQLGTIAFRGTGASHTKVLWNGLDVNSPTLGQSDFANLPLIMDKVVVHYGGASAMYGSDAIGGTVLLGNKSPDFEKSVNASTILETGSFGRFYEALKIGYGGSTFHGKTKIYHFLLKNDFPYKSLRDGSERRQPNASLQKYGVEQQLHYKISESKRLGLTAWYAYNHREIQPTMEVLTSNDELSDKNTRVVLDYFDNSKIGFFNLKAGFIINNQIFNNNGSVVSRQFSFTGNYDKKLTKNLDLRAGIQVYNTKAEVDSYESSVSENRGDVFSSLKYNPDDLLSMVITIRKGFSEIFGSPLAPALGAEYKLMNRQTRKLKLKAQLSRSYRTPTLNDRFWVPGSNPSLEPEDGWGSEFGIFYEKKGAVNFSAETTYYHMLIDDWILWQPSGSIWGPVNVRKVLSQGFEFWFKSDFKAGHFRFDHSGNYGFAKSVSKKKVTANDRTVGNQLPYTPKHKFNFTQNIQYKRWDVNTLVQYTGLRFENTDNIDNVLNAIPAYFLLDLRMGKQFTIGKSDLRVSGAIKNLLNEEYQNLIFRAMPKRNYRLSINYQFNN